MYKVKIIKIFGKRMFLWKICTQDINQTSILNNNKAQASCIMSQHDSCSDPLLQENLTWGIHI